MRFSNKKKKCQDGLGWDEKKKEKKKEKENRNKKYNNNTKY